MNDKISVIIPVFNMKNYLDKCLSTVIEQTYNNLEILLIDDGSTDGSSEICDLYKEKDCRIKVVHKKNAGVSSARNDGLDICTGKYVLFVDADDYLDKYYVEVLYSLIEPEIKMSICGLIRVNTDNEYIQQNQKNINKTIVYSKKEFSQNLNAWGPFCKLFDVDLLKDIRYTPVSISEDLDFLSKVICYNNDFKISCTNQVLYYYRDNCISAMNNKYSEAFYKSVLTQEKVLERFREFNICINDSDILKNAIEVYFNKFYKLTCAERRNHREEFFDVRKIAKSHKQYILNKNNIDIKTYIKRMLMVYCPILYGRITR